MNNIFKLHTDPENEFDTDIELDLTCYTNMALSISIIKNKDCQSTVAKSQCKEITLPVAAWQRVISYLMSEERSLCALVSKRLAILSLCDPSAELEKISQIKTKCTRVSTVKQSTGPSECFFNSSSLSSEASECIQKIKIEIQKDANSLKTIQDVFTIESLFRQYFPIYHAMELNTFLLSYFTKALLSTPYLDTESFPCSPPILRFPSSKGFKSMDAFLLQCPMQDSQWHDHKPEVRQELLSCNPYLFGNITNDEESTWYYYFEDQSLHPPELKPFLKNLCEHYKITYNQKDIEKLISLYKKLQDSAREFEQRNLGKISSGSKCVGRGVLLQILIPSESLDRIAYAAKAFGRLDKTSTLSLSERCTTLQTNPHKEPKMQVRFLIQSIFNSNIIVKIHGCGGFFSDDTLVKPKTMNEEDWREQEKLLTLKDSIFKEMREIFTQMILFPSKDKSTL